ncbi:stress-induced-phosphoprotein 1-like [Apostichopus japonicus]|uniref:stress-induced-phosphoprotein 1-like n=1 Tax=Stichopus japonicus TaxID=307972 RepID=UPI003AB1E9C5
MTDKEKALELKAKGNEAYKKKELDEAISLYTQAIELDGTNVVFFTNRAAAYYEKGDQEKCREDCLKAIEVGIENRCDYSLLAKAYQRIATSYEKEENYAKAIEFYNKSLVEQRVPDVQKRKIAAEKKLKEKERLAYIDPEKAKDAKEKGNKFFQKGDYPAALKSYNEAVQRNPDDAKIFSNRAACYTKLAEFRLALADCDECIRLDPKFAKGYLRKATALFALKEHSKASAAYEKVLELDPNSTEAKEGKRRCFTAQNTIPTDPEKVRERAMADPEIQSIMRDPAMRMILEQMQDNPEALIEHMKNPVIAEKINKLISSGLIALR